MTPSVVWSYTACNVPGTKQRLSTIEMWTLKVSGAYYIVVLYIAFYR